MDLDEIFELRCRNKSVKYISRKTGMRVSDIEREIERNIRQTDDFIKRLIESRGRIGSFKTMNLIDFAPEKMSLERILNEQDIIDYICLKASDHHDRYMDCSRYFIRKSFRK